jgi:predicted Fe-Mo cluster-binding NifX family protein
VEEAKKLAQNRIAQLEKGRREEGMKIAITAGGLTLDSPVDQRFGRAARFILFDTNTRHHRTIVNTQALDSVQGAGIQAAETVARAGTQGLITGHCGPKAFRVLSAAGIRVCTGASCSIAGAITAFESGRLTPAQNADVEGHW